MPATNMTPEQYANWKVEEIRSLASRLIAISEGHQLDLATQIYDQCDNVLLGISDLAKGNKPIRYFHYKEENPNG